MERITQTQPDVKGKENICSKFLTWAHNKAPKSSQTAMYILNRSEIQTSMLRDILDREGLNFYPGSTWTNVEEVIRFYRLDQVFKERGHDALYRWINSRSSRTRYTADVRTATAQQVHFEVMVAGEEGRLVLPNGFYDTAYYQLSPERKMPINLCTTRKIKMLSPVLVVALAFAIFPARNRTKKEKELWEPAENVARRVLERAMSYTVIADAFGFTVWTPPVAEDQREPAPAPDDDRPGDFYRIKQVYETKSADPEPAEPAPTPESPVPQLDYAETLRKLFDSVLTLVEKQAEERGAEKIINQLKEAGKL